MTLSKKPISDVVLNKIQEHHRIEVEFFKIFKNAKGTRFTGSGFELAKPIWKTYTITLPENYRILTKTLLLLDSSMTYPYYLSKRLLVLFNEMDAFEFSLYQGDINLWANKF
jgi:hypothetical protein